MVNEAIAPIKPEHSSVPFDIVEHDQDVKLNQRRTYMIGISCMAVRVVWVGCVCVEDAISVSMRGLSSEIVAGSGKFFEQALACTVTVWLEMNNNGSLRGGIGAGCPWTGEYDHKESSAGRVS